MLHLYSCINATDVHGPWLCSVDKGSILLETGYWLVYIGNSVAENDMVFLWRLLWKTRDLDFTGIDVGSSNTHTHTGLQQRVRTLHRHRNRLTKFSSIYSPCSSRMYRSFQGQNSRSISSKMLPWDFKIKSYSIWENTDISACCLSLHGINLTVGRNFDFEKI